MTEPAELGSEMTRRDRDDLQRVVRMRARLAKSGIATQEAELLADVEQQLSSIYALSDEAWSDLTRQAQEEIAKADAELAKRCAERGIPPEFRPKLHLAWSSRGQNAIAERRTELRRLAQARIKASGLAAKQAIEDRSLGLLTALITGGLESDEARRQVASLPTPEQLMPRLDVQQLEQERAGERLRLVGGGYDGP